MKTSNLIRDADKSSGAGRMIGLIVATTKRGNGSAEPLTDPITYLIKNGQHATWVAPTRHQRGHQDGRSVGS